MLEMLEKIRHRWGVKNNFQIFLILGIFSVTGISALQVRQLAFSYMGISVDDPFVLKFVLWLLIVFPSYYLLFNIYGFIFGQFNFCWSMTKKSFSRFKKLKNIFNFIKK